MTIEGPKRFYEKAEAAPGEGGWRVFLDGREARTMGRRSLACRSKALAEAVAGEWAAQGAHIDRNAMPLTALLSAALDGGPEKAGEWAEEVLNYLGSDLVCYRAGEPALLVARQAEVWDPYLDWFAAEYGTRLVAVTGLIAAPQPEAALNAARRDLSEKAPETLLGLKIATAITGSAVLALALWKGAFAPEAIFRASRLDERFQEERWGVDGEAKARERQMEAEFAGVAGFIRLIGRDR